MRKLFVFILLLGGIVLFSQCSRDQKKTDAECVMNDPNPNKSSELAVLMRKMATHAEQTKAQVLAGKLTGTFPEEFRKILTATPTDSLVKGDHFNAFAEGYLKNLELLYSGGPDLNAGYNAVISSCVSCHETTCPGPLVRIKKFPV